MPTLKQITCAIELGPGNTRLKEYGHRVTDGAVETYIVAPETSDIPFHVRVTSDGYIAPGLAGYVFMDGEYQCNRNRLHLRFPEDGVSADEYQIDFKLRQKEEKTSAGTFIARDWYFTPLNTGNADKVSSSKDFKDNVGTIEVVILRCKDGGGEELSTDPAQTTVSMNPSPAVHTPSRRLPSNRELLVRGPSKHTDSSVSKQYSVPGSFDGMMMMGIFDGAGDDPGYYKRYRPKSIVGQEPLPGHKWDPSTGQYRYFNDQDPFVNLRDQEDKYGNIYPSDRYRPQTYTVGGNVSDQESEAPQKPRIDGKKSHVPQTSPGYDFSTRRRKSQPRPNVSEESIQSSYDFTRSRRHGLEKRLREQEVDEKRREQEAVKKREEELAEKKHLEQKAEKKYWEREAEKKFWKHEEKKKRREQEEKKKHGEGQPAQSPSPPARLRPASEVSVEQLWPGSGMAFVEEKGQQMVERVNRFHSELGKYAALKEDAKRYREIKEIHAEMMKALKSKHEEIAKIMDELKRSYEVMKDIMSSMDRMTWRRASDLLFEMGLYPPPVLIVSEPEQDVGGEEKAPSSDPFVQVGENTWGNAPSQSGSKKETSEKPEDPWITNDRAASNHAKTEAVWSNHGDGMPAGNDGGWNEPKSAENEGGWADNNSKTKDAKKNADEEKRQGSRRSRGNDGANSETCSFGDSQPKPVIKPYWSEWTKKPVMVEPKVQPRRVYEYPASPMPAIPSSKKDKGITQAVHAGPGANYAHRLHRPEYLDSMAKPYAIFTFKYRSKAALEKILKHKIDDSYISEAKAEAKKHRLLSMQKHELVEELMKKTVIAAQSEGPSRAASNKNDEWDAVVGRLSSAKRQTSHKELPARARSNKTWQDMGEVKPDDSVSQHSSRGWAGDQKSNAAKSKAEWGAAGWGSEKHESKKDKSVGGDGGRSSKKKSAVSYQHWVAPG